MNSKAFHNWLNVSSKNFNKGINFGHKSIKLAKTPFWHPLMSDYFLGIRQNVSLLNTQQTLKCLLRAFHILAIILKQKGRVLIINTNPEFFKLCNHFIPFTRSKKNTSTPYLSEKHIDEKKNLCSLDNSINLVNRKKSKIPLAKIKTPQHPPLLSYVSYKWIGGTLTNWKQISKSVYTFALFAERCENFLYKNSIDFPKYVRVKKCFQGLLSRHNKKMWIAFNEKPDCIFLMNPNENQNILYEASLLHIPVIALTESNTNSKNITYPIPVNNYSIKFIYYCLKKIYKIYHI